MTRPAAELNQPQWAVRYGFFQVPRRANGVALDSHYVAAWAMVAEFERRYASNQHPGAVRWLAYLNRADMGSYQAALDNPARPADIVATRDYRYKSGCGLNVEQELVPNLGLFSRLGWSNGKTEGWMFSDVDHAASLGLRLKGEAWHRPADVFALAVAFNGLSACPSGVFGGRRHRHSGG